jgi:hypothetical protein
VPLRSFCSSDGTPWEVWEVVPSGESVPWTHQRVRDRRSPEPVLRYRGEERRRGERRTRGPFPARLASELMAGWLVFESPRERKRLAPPPPGWDSCPEAMLITYLERATRRG